MSKPFWSYQKPRPLQSDSEEQFATVYVKTGKVKVTLDIVVLKDGLVSVEVLEQHGQTHVVTHWTVGIAMGTRVLVKPSSGKPI